MKNVARAYPQHKKDLDRLHRETITATDTDGIRTQTGTTARPTERTALTELGRAEMKEYEAVLYALSITAKHPKTGKERVALVERSLFRQQRLDAAAADCYVSYRTARRWQSDFIKLMAEYYGLL